MTMYVLRTCRWFGANNPSGVPDGQFVRDAEHFTENKKSAMLFDTGLEAEDFAQNVFGANNGRLSHDGTIIPLWVVAVSTKPTIDKIGETIGEV